MSKSKCNLFIKNSKNKIDNWLELSKNRNAIPLLKANFDKINWYRISKNPSIFQCDYTFHRKRMDVHREELMKAVFHPKRLKCSLELGCNLFDEI